MSFAEVQQQVKSFTPEQRRRLQKLLVDLEREQDPKWLAEIARRKREMKAGKKVTREEAMRLLGLTEEDIAAAKA